jgi:hypothetical protein
MVSDGNSASNQASSKLFANGQACKLINKRKQQVFLCPFPGE